MQEFEQHRPLLHALRQLDKQRLLAWAAAGGSNAQQQGNAHERASPQPDGLQLMAVAEMLTWPRYLHDSELCAAAVSLLQQLDWQLSTDGALYPGFWQLLAHPDAAVRSQVGGGGRRVGGWRGSSRPASKARAVQLLSGAGVAVTLSAALTLRASPS
jgi:hypothetical protein